MAVFLLCWQHLKCAYFSPAKQCFKSQKTKQINQNSQVKCGVVHWCHVLPRGQSFLEKIKLLSGWVGRCAQFAGSEKKMHAVQKGLFSVGGVSSRSIIHNQLREAGRRRVRGPQNRWRLNREQEWRLPRAVGCSDHHQRMLYRRNAVDRGYNEKDQEDL